MARGDVLAHPGDAPRVADRLQAALCWFADEPFDPRGRYLARIGTRTVTARIGEIAGRLDLASLQQAPPAAGVTRNRSHRRGSNCNRRSRAILTRPTARPAR